MPLGPVVSCSTLPEDKVVRTENLSVRAGPNRVHSSGLEIEKDCARNIFTTACLVKSQWWSCLKHPFTYSIDGRTYDDGTYDCIYLPISMTLVPTSDGIGIHTSWSMVPLTVNAYVPRYFFGCSISSVSQLKDARIWALDLNHDRILM